MISAMDEEEAEPGHIRKERENLKQWKREVQCASNLATLLEPFAAGQVTGKAVVTL